HAWGPAWHWGERARHQCPRTSWRRDTGSDTAVAAGKAALSRAGAFAAAAHRGTAAPTGVDPSARGFPPQPRATNRARGRTARSVGFANPDASRPIVAQARRIRRHTTATCTV